jgi:hypothetical protein
VVLIIYGQKRVLLRASQNQPRNNMDRFHGG